MRPNSPTVHFRDLSIKWKLLLSSVLPVFTLIILSVVTYQSVETFSDDEERLSKVYFAQRRSAEYMRLVVDLETGFRGYVLTKQERFLRPYRLAQTHIIETGWSLQSAASRTSSQFQLLAQVQALVERLMSEKDELIEAIKAGRSVDAIHYYIELGRGRELMPRSETT